VVTWVAENSRVACGRPVGNCWVVEGVEEGPCWDVKVEESCSCRSNLGELAGRTARPFCLGQEPAVHI
jgi:hypothetical protein